MTMKSSLFAISMMAIGATFAGSAMASEYSESASQRIAEANRAAVEPQVPGVFAEQPPIPDANVLEAMVHTPDASTVKSASNDVLDITPRDRTVSNNPDRTFQGWWKD